MLVQFLVHLLVHPTILKTSCSQSLYPTYHYSMIVVQQQDLYTIHYTSNTVNTANHEQRNYLIQDMSHPLHYHYSKSRNSKQEKLSTSNNMTTAATSSTLKLTSLVTIMSLLTLLVSLLVKTTSITLTILLLIKTILNNNEATNPALNFAANQIPIAYSYASQLYLSCSMLSKHNQINDSYCPYKIQKADFLTKFLGPTLFKACRPIHRFLTHTSFKGASVF